MRRQDNVKRGAKLRKRRPRSAKRFMILVWKSHEVARGKSPMSWS